MFRYTIQVVFDDDSVAEEWLEWLREGHAADLIAGGAERVEVIQLDGPQTTLEARYDFRDRDAFEQYERESAPRLREEGTQRFPPSRGARYRRSTGVVVFRE
jgi:hypothetical protein